MDGFHFDPASTLGRNRKSNLVLILNGFPSVGDALSIPPMTP